MRKIDNRDLPNMRTSQDLIRRYDLSALDQLSAIKGNDNAIGVGMEPTVEAGVQSKDGFYDGNGNNIFTTSKYLPDGDASLISYWQTVEAGRYWYNYTVSSIANMPSGYGFVDVLVNGTSISIIYHRMTTDYIYHKAVSSGTITDWKVFANEDDIADILAQLNGFKYYKTSSDLGYSAGVQLATICSAMLSGTEYYGQHSDFASGNMPTADLWCVEIKKHSEYRCRIIATRGSNWVGSSLWAYGQNWRIVEGLTGWHQLN